MTPVILGPLIGQIVTEPANVAHYTDLFHAKRRKQGLRLIFLIELRHDARAGDQPDIVGQACFNILNGLFQRALSGHSVSWQSVQQLLPEA